jgi:hypothetical protein
VRFAFFTNGEEPYFSEGLANRRHVFIGSRRYAEGLAQCGTTGTGPRKIDVMFSLEPVISEGSGVASPK